jgi:hypothetical protein
MPRSDRVRDDDRAEPVPLSCNGGAGARVPLDENVLVHRRLAQ